MPSSPFSLQPRFSLLALLLFITSVSSISLADQQNIRPITPAEVDQAKVKQIPAEVISVVNEMITEAWDGSQAVLKQKDVAARIAKKLRISIDEVFDRHLLDFEGAFRAVGWKVFYDKPGYNESYEATFQFSKPD